jgi:FemAB-related protein (PEP-CTERM system-associated)
MARWDEFVEQSQMSTFFHRSGWKHVVEKALGHTTHFLYAESRGNICGILPLAHIHSWLFGNALISTPFCVYGGTVAYTEKTRWILDNAAVKLAHELKVEYLELRNRSPYHANWPTKDLYVTFRKDMDPDPEKNLLNVPRKQRRMIRQGIKAGLVSEIDETVDRFYDLYAISVRNLGTPVLSKRYFQSLKAVFGKDLEILTVMQAGRPISSVMSFYFKDEVLPYYGGGSREARRSAANDFMYWELMRRACEKGLRVFDYGRSKKGTGSYSFKKNWGFPPSPLYYEYQLISAKSVPDINPLNPRYRLFVNAWRHMPVALSKLVGPMIARYLG